MEHGLQYQFQQKQIQNLPADIIKTGSWAISQIYRNGGNLYEFYMPKWLGVDAQTGAPQWEMLTKDANGTVTGQSAYFQLCMKLLFSR